MGLVLVTGGAGFIGSHLVEALLSRRYRVRVLDNLSQGRREYLPASDRIEFAEGDVTDAATCREAVRGVEGVFHLAAMSKVAPSLGDPEAIRFCTEQNVLGTINVLEAALRHKESIRKVIYSASSTYYGTNPPPHAEDQRPACQSPYAVSKYVGELYCDVFTRMHALPTVRLRYFMTYGPRQPSTGPYAVVTGVFMKQWEDRQPLTLLGDGSQTRDFIHARDVAEGSVEAFEGAVGEGTINIGTGRAMTIKALADLISPDQVVLPRRPHDIPHQQADTARMRRLLGWEPKVDLTDYLKTIIRRKLDEEPDHYARPSWYEAERRSAPPAPGLPNHPG